MLIMPVWFFNGGCGRPSLPFFFYFLMRRKRKILLAVGRVVVGAHKLLFLTEVLNLQDGPALGVNVTAKQAGYGEAGSLPPGDVGVADIASEREQLGVQERVIVKYAAVIVGLLHESGKESFAKRIQPVDAIGIGVAAADEFIGHEKEFRAKDANGAKDEAKMGTGGCGGLRAIRRDRRLWDRETPEELNLGRGHLWRFLRRRVFGPVV